MSDKIDADKIDADKRRTIVMCAVTGKNISAAFTWEKTKEGHIYWSERANNPSLLTFEDRARILSFKDGQTDERV